MRAIMKKARDIAPSIAGSRQAEIGWLIAPMVLIVLVLAVYGGQLVVYTGQIGTLLAATITVPFIVYSLHHPMPAVLLSMLVGTQFFQFIPLENMPGLRLGGFTLNLSDLFTLLLLIVAAYRLPKLNRRLMFGSFVLIWVAYVGARFGINLLSGEADLKLSLNQLRYQIGWLGYLSFVAIIESPRDLRIYVRFILIIMMIAVGIQLFEASQGNRINLFGLGTNEYWAGTRYIIVKGQSVPYLWSRAVTPTLLALFLCLGCALEGVRVRRHLFLAAMGVLAILLTDVRAWFFGLGAGLVAILLLQRQRARGLFRASLLLMCLLAIVVVLTPFMVRSYGNNPWDVWLTRAGQLIDFSSQGNFIGRVAQINLAWTQFRYSPLMGYGWGSTFRQYKTETGFNMLLIHGIVGSTIILAMYLYIAWGVYRLWSRLPPSTERGYLAGMLALVVLYLSVVFSQDSLNAGGVSVLAGGLVDRISMFEEAGLIIEGT